MARTHRAALLALLATVAGCTATKRALYDPAGLRDELRVRAPAIPAEELVIPYEVPAAEAARAAKIVGNAASEWRRMQLLVQAMFDRHGWGLRYSARGGMGNASETLARKAGNCFDLASVFIGLSRSVGLRSSYMDASRRVPPARSAADGLTVNAGHVTAVVDTERGQITLDFASGGDIVSYRVISDVEAVANFYNNRGFERVEAAAEQGMPPNWAEAGRDFERAVQVFPDFARGWNNLGIAAVRLGRPDEAVAHYRTAIARDPSFAAPHNNLGLLHLSRRELRDAIRELEAAAALAPTAYNTQFELAVARQQAGDVEGARKALDRALELKGDYPEAEALRRTLR